MEDFLERGWWQVGEKNTIIQQHPNIKSYMLELLAEVRPELIIEIGTSFGGLAVVISEVIKELNLSTGFDSYESSIRQWIPELAEHYGFNLINKSIGDPETDKEIILKIQNTSGRVVILCDGGGKPYEFNTFAPALKPGDVIGGHDYAVDRIDFETRVQGKLWNWLELEYAHVAHSIESSNLVDLPNGLSDKAKEVVWLVKVKA